MGYFMRGSIGIDPPLNYTEIITARQIALDLVQKRLPYAIEENVFDLHVPLKLLLDEFDKTTEDGVLHVIRSSALVPSSEAEYSEGDCEEIERLVQKLSAGLPGHNWKGVFTMLPEEGTHARKVIVTSDEDAGINVEMVMGTAYM